MAECQWFINSAGNFMVRFEWDLIFHSNTSTSLKREKPDFDYYALKESYAEKISWFFFKKKFEGEFFDCYPDGRDRMDERGQTSY